MSKNKAGQTFAEIIEAKGWSDQPATVGHLAASDDAMWDFIDSYFAKHKELAHAPILARIEALEARLAEAEKRSMSYRGTWAGAAGEYVRGDCVTSSGSLWVATIDAPGRPGAPDSGWQLAVKNGAA